MPHSAERSTNLLKRGSGPARQIQCLRGARRSWVETAASRRLWADLRADSGPLEWVCQVSAPLSQGRSWPPRPAKRTSPSTDGQAMPGGSGRAGQCARRGFVPSCTAKTSRERMRNRCIARRRLGRPSRRRIEIARFGKAASMWGTAPLCIRTLNSNVNLCSLAIDRRLSGPCPIHLSRLSEKRGPPQTEPRVRAGNAAPTPGSSATATRGCAPAGASWAPAALADVRRSEAAVGIGLAVADLLDMLGVQVPAAPIHPSVATGTRSPH